MTQFQSDTVPAEQGLVHSCHGTQELMSTALKFAQARLSPPTFGQVAAEAAIDTPESYFKEVKAEYLERRNYVVESLNAMDGVFCPKPSGAFYCIARLPIDNSDTFCQWLLEEFSYEQRNGNACTCNRILFDILS